VPPGLLPRFFQRVTQRSFGDLALDDAAAASYLADLLTRFARSEALYAVRDLAPRRLEGVGAALAAIERAWDAGSPHFRPESERALRRHIGDYTLFMTGVFREHVDRLAVTSFYEAEGSRAYRFVSETARTGGLPDAPLYRRLSERFEHYAGVLTYARKVYMRAEPWAPGEWPGDPFAGLISA